MSRFIRASAALTLAAAPAVAVAHAFGTRYDLPLPLPLWLGAAGLTVALSFVVLALALRRHSRASARRVMLFRLPRLVLPAMRAVSACVLFLVVAAGWLGTQDPFRNLVPAFVWIAWWIGFTYLVAVAGDLWSLANPWDALYGWAQALARRPLGLGWRLPQGVGAWPAVLLLLAFAWIELVWEGNAVPANIAWLAVGYSALTWTGMFFFGREAWLRSGEMFAAYFGWLARLAPIEWQRDRCLVRPPAAGLLDAQPTSASQAFFVIVMLATVTFDGLRETPLWAGGDSPVAMTAGLFALPLVFALVILATSAWMALLARPSSALELACRFVPALLPIAFAYHVAHYLSYLLVAGQVVIPLASDPLGRGWDLFGTAHYRIAAGIVGARFAWYVSVAVIVAGHVLAMYVAHRFALERFADARLARRSQIPFAALMVGYTMLSLWILAQPIVENMK